MKQLEDIKKSEILLKELKDKVRIQSKSLKKLQEDDKINDEAAAQGNLDVETDFRKKEDTENQMVKEIEILA